MKNCYSSVKCCVLFLIKYVAICYLFHACVDQLHFVLFMWIFIFSSNKDGHCCADFKYMNGGCERKWTGINLMNCFVQKVCISKFRLIFIFSLACYGAYGVNCTLNCNTGFYGFGCRSKCICHPEEFCDSRFGCIQNSTFLIE